MHGNDEGTWRRIHKIESDHTFARSNVRDALVEQEGEGILMAAVAVAGEWYTHGLGESPRVRAATRAYREQQDLLGQFFAECLTFEPEAFTSKADLHAAYQQWRSEEGVEHGVSPKEIAARLLERGCSPGHRRVGGKPGPRGWFGVRRVDSRAIQ